MPEKVSHPDPGDLGRLSELIRGIRVALPTTVDRDGYFDTRPVQTLQVEADKALWFFTDRSSSKVNELHHDVRVSVGYADPAINVFVAAVTAAVTGTLSGMIGREPQDRVNSCRSGRALIADSSVFNF